MHIKYLARWRTHKKHSKTCSLVFSLGPSGLPPFCHTDLRKQIWSLQQIPQIDSHNIHSNPFKDAPGLDCFITRVLHRTQVQPSRRTCAPERGKGFKSSGSFMGVGASFCKHDGGEAWVGATVSIPGIAGIQWRAAAVGFPGQRSCSWFGISPEIVLAVWYPSLFPCHCWKNL